MGKQSDKAIQEEYTDDERKMQSNGQRLGFIDKLIARTMGQDNSVGREDDPARMGCPVLWWLMTNVDLPNGWTCEPATLTIRAVPGGFNMMLSHKVHKLQVPCTSAFLHELWEEMEKKLHSVEAYTEMQRGTKLPKRRKKFDPES